MEKSIAMNKTNKGNMLFSLSMTVEDIIKRSTKSWLWVSNIKTTSIKEKLTEVAFILSRHNVHPPPPSAVGEGGGGGCWTSS